MTNIILLLYIDTCQQSTIDYYLSILVPANHLFLLLPNKVVLLSVTFSSTLSPPPIICVVVIRSAILVRLNIDIVVFWEFPCILQ